MKPHPSSCHPRFGLRLGASGPGPDTPGNEPVENEMRGLCGGGLRIPAGSCLLGGGCRSSET
jgi:hypothetical protein